MNAIMTSHSIYKIGKLQCVCVCVCEHLLKEKAKLWTLLKIVLMDQFGLKDKESGSMHSLESLSKMT